mmetsp:Transcript_14873/g.33880  ORF Transcript_14873/g.33880 Transcript_14873/m.33880 type:complete len:407 (-) Transcript_14873:155-1375(-)
MDYFAVGARPILSRFPPHIPGIFTQVSAHGADEVTTHSGGVPDVPLDEELGDSSAPPTTGDSAGGPPGCDGKPCMRIAPNELHAPYDPTRVMKWKPLRFQHLRKLQDATRNQGQVHLMKDCDRNDLVAVKQMPTKWVMTCHAEFIAEHPTETEMPWQDIGCVAFLNSCGYAYACKLYDVFRDDTHTYIVTSFATDGDLFAWCEVGPPPGRERERVVQPLAVQILEGVQQLHEASIVHRDLSLENILLSKIGDPRNPVLRVQIIDFSMASTKRTFKNCVRGKASYQAPELHTDKEYDAFLTDAFSVGVTLYAVLLKDYPWLSTRPGGCKCFEYVRNHGFRSYLAKRKLRNSNSRVTEFMSEPLIQLLEGLLALDPDDRLTLGESSWAEESGRRSVWDEPWLRIEPGD